jgi:allophanate hydrolase
VVPACRTLDVVSIFALTVDDAHAAFRAAAGFDADDPWSRPVATSPLGEAPPQPAIGIPSRASLRVFGDMIQADSFEAACVRLAGLGADLREIDFEPFHAVAELLYGGAWVAERHAVVGDLMASDPDAVLPVIRQIVGRAPSFSATDAFRDLYRLEALRRQVAPLIASVDVLCVPSIPTFVTVAEVEADPIGPNSRLGTYTNFVNLLGLCGLTVPTPPRADGRPGSVTLLAPAGCDGLIAALGRRIERWEARTLGAIGMPVPPAEPALVTAGPDEIEVAVCGAHMSGLPLNGELTRLGGRFLRAPRTRPQYQLFSLPGGPPRRPGMVRTAEGEGASIGVEVWALPRANFGAFIAGIPAPLSIGTVLLADGTSPKGFLCETAGTAGARDVSALGDWRRVLAEAAA